MGDCLHRDERARLPQNCHRLSLWLSLLLVLTLNFVCVSRIEFVQSFLICQSAEIAEMMERKLEWSSADLICSEGG